MSGFLFALGLLRFYPLVRSHLAVLLPRRTLNFLLSLPRTRPKSESWYVSFGV